MVNQVKPVKSYMGERKTLGTTKSDPSFESPNHGWLQAPVSVKIIRKLSAHDPHSVTIVGTFKSLSVARNLLFFLPKSSSDKVHMEIPQDIIYNVITAVGDDKCLLRQCALVSSSFL